MSIVADVKLNLPPFHILVPVWGRTYCALFSEISLPSQLSAGNLPALPHLQQSLFHIFTHADDAEFLREQPSFRRLADLMPVKVSTFEGPVKVPHATMSECLRRGIAEADAVDGASLFFNPDFVVADGTYRSLARLVGEGKRVVFTTGVRTLKESLVPELAEGFRGADGSTIAIGPRALVGLAMRHLHPISLNHFWDAGEGGLVPANLFWQVGDEGLLAHCFHLHPLLVHPANKQVAFSGTVDDDFVQMACPDRAADHVVTDSDELLVCEISGWQHAVETRFRKGSIADVVTWAEANTDACHRHLVSIPIRFHAGNVAGTQWDAAQARAKVVVREVQSRLESDWGALLLRSPLRAVHRLVKRASELATHQRNGSDGTAAGAAGMAAGAVLAGFHAYRDFCRRYVAFRAATDRALAGSRSAPRPWSGAWLSVRAPARAVAAALAGAGPRVLVLSGDRDLAAALAARLPSAEVATWPQAGIATDIRSLERWPFDDSAFDAVACAGILHHAPDPHRFLAELARVLRPGGRAAVTAPFLLRPPQTVGGDYWRMTRDGAGIATPSGLALAEERPVGGFGSAFAGLVFAWGCDLAERRRLSPVVLEIPLLPVLVPARLAAVAMMVALAWLLDRLDNTGRFYPQMVLTFDRSQES